MNVWKCLVIDLDKIVGSLICFAQALRNVISEAMNTINCREDKRLRVRTVMGITS